MKKLLFAVSALAALSLLAPSAGFAQAHNQIGMYTDPSGDPATAGVPTTTLAQTITAYLVLTNPYNYAFGTAGNEVERAVTNVNGFECQVINPADAGIVANALTFPQPGIDIGTAPDHVVGYSAPAAVQPDGSVVVATASYLMISTTTPYEIFLNITSIPSIPGTMAYVDADDSDLPTNLVSMYPASGGFENPVFRINTTPAVAIEGESWGGVKALFR